MDSSVATRDAMPATIVVAWANFAPVPPAIAEIKRRGDDKAHRTMDGGMVSWCRKITGSVREDK